ncbi:MAG: TetR/AcrR family transcriptional regulator [Ktedonobacterales bacterium]
MPFPAKTTAQSIIAAAIARLEAFGRAGLSMRALAGVLGITPHALYHYFPDRAALEAAIAEASYRELLVAMRSAVDHLPGCQAPLTALAAAAEAYLAFAEAHPARYSLMIAAPHDQATPSQAQDDVWLFVGSLLAPMTGRPDNDDAILALWALLHGFVALGDAGVAKARDHVKNGFAIFLAGLKSSAVS